MRLPLSLTIFAAVALAGTANAAERRFDATGFDRVSAAGSEDVAVTTGKGFSVVATGSSEHLDALDIRVEDGTLKIGRKNRFWGSWSSDNTRIAVTVPTPLKGVKLAGSGNVNVDRGAGPAFNGELAGSGNLKIATIDSPVVELTLAGSGNIAAAGRCGAGKIAVAGSGDAALEGLACASLDVRVAGSGNVNAHASQTANLRVTGSGNVRVRGGARCQISKTGSGSMDCG